MRKVKVRAYQKADGTRVRGYTREDPRTKVYHREEADPEIEEKSFLGEGYDEDMDSGEEDREGE